MYSWKTLNESFYFLKNGIWNDKCSEGGKIICYLKENCGAMLMWNDGYFLLSKKWLYWGWICMQKKSASIFKSMAWRSLTNVCIHIATTQSTYRKCPSFSKVPQGFFIAVAFLIFIGYVKYNTDKSIQEPLCLFAFFPPSPVRGHWYAFCQHMLVLPVLEHHINGIHFLLHVSGVHSSLWSKNTNIWI